MTTLLPVVTFAAVYAASATLVNRINVYWLGFWDRKFASQANVAVADEVLPIFVALATLSFLAGLSVQRAVAGRASSTAGAVAAGVCGIVASVLLLSEPASAVLVRTRGSRELSAWPHSGQVQPPRH